MNGIENRIERMREFNKRIDSIERDIKLVESKEDYYAKKLFNSFYKSR